MIKKYYIALIILCSFNGCLYTDIKVPLDDDVWETKLGSKVGVSSSHTILWLVSWGDAGVKRAAENGSMTIVHHLDRGVNSYFFGAYTKIDTIAYGD